MKVTFESQKLPDDHPAWQDDRSGLISKRWWEVTVVDDNGKEHAGNVGWYDKSTIQEIVREITRPERPSERVMRMLAETDGR